MPLQCRRLPIDFINEWSALVSVSAVAVAAVFAVTAVSFSVLLLLLCVCVCVRLCHVSFGSSNSAALATTSLMCQLMRRRGERRRREKVGSSAISTISSSISAANWAHCLSVRFYFFFHFFVLLSLTYCVCVCHRHLNACAQNAHEGFFAVLFFFCCIFFIVVVQATRATQCAYLSEAVTAFSPLVFATAAAAHDCVVLCSLCLCLCLIFTSLHFAVPSSSFFIPFQWDFFFSFSFSPLFVSL